MNRRIFLFFLTLLTASALQAQQSRLVKVGEGYS